MSNIRKAIIMGGGIGGHTLAVALEQAGIEVQLFERAPKLGEVGAGVGLWANAVRVLDDLGIGGRVRKLGMPLRRAEFVSWRGRVLSALDIEAVASESESGAGCYVVHRAELLEAIAGGVSPGVARTGRECVRIEQDHGSARAFFKDGESAEGDILIGADGINSVVRAALWGQTPVRYSGQTCYRGISPVAPADPQVVREFSGPGLRCAICPLDANRIYWWAALEAPQGEKDSPGERQEFLLKQFQGWPFGFTEIISATPSEGILRNDLIDRPPLRQWSRGRVTLVGDAAHPTTPNLGQGACMAIEDAPALTRALQSQPTVEEAFRAYEVRRLRRTSEITKDSWVFGQVTRWRHPLMVWLRETMIRSTPAFVSQRLLRQQVREPAGL